MNKQKYEVAVIAIPEELKAAHHILAGNPEALSNRPASIWDTSRIHFLSDLSKRLLTRKDIRALPDVVTFAYWARKANLKKLEENYKKSNNLQVGLGVVFHICPSNVPVNFAFSMAFGLLAGNSCVLRLSSKESETVSVISQTIKELLSEDAHKPIAKSLLLIKYDHNDEITRFWMNQADGRIIWGGDETIKHMRSFSTKPRSREVMFADRYSMCVLSPDAILSLDEKELSTLCHGMFNDIYLMDQAACSSPQLVAWVGQSQKIKEAQKKLWSKLSKHVEDVYELQPIQAMNKFVDACNNAISNETITSVKSHGNNSLYRFEINALRQDQDECRGYNGSIHEVSLSSLDELSPIISEIYQTLTYFGFDKEDFFAFIQSNGLRGIDRIVPVGQALDMSITWDGFDLIQSLSRVVEFR